MAKDSRYSLVIASLSLVLIVLFAAVTTDRVALVAHDNLALIETLQRAGQGSGAKHSGVGGARIPADAPHAPVAGSRSIAFRSPWKSIKARLALGDYATAAELVPELTPQIGQDGLRYYYVLSAAQKGGHDDWVIHLYETLSPPQPAAIISDIVYLSYIQRGEPRDFERALSLQPNNLLSRYQLWRQSVADGDQGAAAEHLERLTYFPLEVFEPTDQALAQAAIEVASALAEDGVWDQERLLRTAAYLVFRQPEMPAVERLLTRWASRQDAKQAEWLFLLAELNHRRNQHQVAQAYYLDVLKRDPDCWQATRRLAELWQVQARQAGTTQQEAFAQAARWYRRTNELIPGDAVTVKNWAGVCASLEQLHPRAGQSPDCADAQPDPFDAGAEIREVAGGLFGVLSEDVRLGPNRISNGSMEKWGFRMPDTWFFSNQATWDSRANRGVVSLTDDRLDTSEGTAAARFDVLALEQDPGKEAARYSLVTRPSSAISLRPGQWYAIAITYRTDEMTGTPITVDLVDTDMGSLGIEQELMPATGGRWARRIFLRQLGGDRPEQALLWLRGWQAGRVWFDDVSIQGVDLDSQSPDRGEGRAASR